MTLYLIGLGLGDYKDISVKGLEAIKKCDIIYLESYTSILQSQREDIAKFYNKQITIASRETVEQGGDMIIQEAKEKDVALLIVGDVFGATTHTDIFSRAKKAGIKVKVIFNASIMTAIGIVGLELYKYGKTISIIFEDPKWPVESHYENLKQNQVNGLHTLALLDIKVAEPSREDLKKGINRFQVPRYMTVNQGIQALLNIERRKKEGIFTKETICIGCARIGHENYIIKVGTAKELLKIDFGEPLHSLVIPGKLGHFEKEMLEFWK